MFCRYTEPVLFNFCLIVIINRSGLADSHQPLDAILEEYNRTLKVWLLGEPDPDVWKSAVRNHDKLTSLREYTLSALSISDPKTAP